MCTLHQSHMEEDLHVLCRVQVAPRLCDLVEGDLPQEKYYFYDGLQYSGRFVDLKQSTWVRISPQWLVHRVGKCNSVAHELMWCCRGHQDSQ